MMKYIWLNTAFKLVCPNKGSENFHKSCSGLGKNKHGLPAHKQSVGNPAHAVKTYLLYN